MKREGWNAQNSPKNLPEPEALQRTCPSEPNLAQARSL